MKGQIKYVPYSRLSSINQAVVRYLIVKGYNLGLSDKLIADYVFDGSSLTSNTQHDVSKIRRKILLLPNRGTKFTLHDNWEDKLKWFNNFEKGALKSYRKELQMASENIKIKKLHESDHEDIYMKPWKDPESLFCDGEFLEELTGKKIKTSSECHKG